MSRRTWLILGASSAVARAFAREVAAAGADLILAGRDTADLARSAADLRIRHQINAAVLAFDAADCASHQSFVAACRATAGGPLDVFLAFAAMPDQAAIDSDPTLGLSAIQTTFVGAVSILSRLAPLLEAQGDGQVIVLGSVAGARGRRKNYTYGAAKAGLHAYVQGLRARLCPSGVRVLTVKPGFIDTAMTWGLPGLFLVASPEACAHACLVHARRGAEVCYYPRFWWGIMTIVRAIPERLFKRLNI